MPAMPPSRRLLDQGHLPPAMHGLPPAGGERFGFKPVNKRPTEPTAKRTKPPCCDETGQAPVDPELFDRFSVGPKALVRISRRAR
jgi:hypothetical protein